MAESPSPLLKVEILGYRGFATKEVLRLGFPNGKPGSGLTVLVGPNNCGKSSVIEVLSFLRAPGQQVDIDDSQLNTLTNGAVELVYNFAKCQVKLSVSGAAPARWEGITDPLPRGLAYVLGSRRFLEATFQTQDAGERREHSVRSPDVAKRQQTSSGLVRRLQSIEANRPKYDKLLRRVLPDAPPWYVARQPNGTNHIKVTGPGASHPSDGLGSGVLSMLHIIDALFDSPKGDIIVIDEPELSLHPSAQRRLASLLIELAAQRQIVLATHSPHIAALECLCNGASVARVHLQGGQSRIGQVSKATAQALEPLLRDFGNPRLLGVEAREVLFLEDGAILVEGQDDVLGYRRIFEQCGSHPAATFFGWGVGGAGNMGAIAALLRDLGISRVFGLLDGDKTVDCERLSREYSMYRFATLPAPDMRVRRERVLPARDGALDAEGLIHGHLKEACRELTEEVARYFDS